MARGTALSELVEMTKAELMADTDNAVSPGGDAIIKLQLAMQQKWLALRWHWPFLKLEKDVDLTAGENIYDFPNTAGTGLFELGKPVAAFCYFGELWNELCVGINPKYYNSLNPDLDHRADPVTNWDFFRESNATALKFEVWPLPATANKIRFVGQMTLPDLTGDAHTAILDDLLIVQFTAAKLATRMKQADAPALLAQANETLRELRKGYSTETVEFCTSGPSKPPRDWQRPTVATMISP